MDVNDLVSSFPQEVAKRYSYRSKRMADKVVNNLDIDDPIVHELDELDKFHYEIGWLVTNIGFEMYYFC